MNNAILDSVPELPQCALPNGSWGHEMQNAPAGGKAISEVIAGGEVENAGHQCVLGRAVCEAGGGS